jgi:hypothetical protein
MAAIGGTAADSDEEQSPAPLAQSCQLACELFNLYPVDGAGYIGDFVKIGLGMR